MSNESFLNNEVGWSPEYLQESWSASVAAEIASIASFDPRPVVVGKPEKRKQIFDAKTREWYDVTLPNEFNELTELAPDSVPSVEAQHWPDGHLGVDMRPHLWDGKQFVLVDSGSQVCTFPPEPGDQVDPNMALRAVNGAKINCYGTKMIEVKIG